MKPCANCSVIPAAPRDGKRPSLAQAFGGWLHHPTVDLHRRSVRRVAIGLFCGLIPGPLQMISAALLAVLFRSTCRWPFITLYTNPLTSCRCMRWLMSSAHG